MTTKNEELLRDAIADVQRKTQEITAYLTMLQQTIQTIAVGNANSGQPQVHFFFNQQQVFIPGPGSCDTNICVYVEISPGKYKMSSPVITFQGCNIELNFDMPVNGYAVIEDTAPTNGPYVDVPSAPVPFLPTPLGLIVEAPDHPIDETVVDQPTSKMLEPGSTDYDRAMRHMGIE